MVDTTPISETELSVELPEFFPQQNLIVEQERHRFEVFQKDFTTEPQLEYQLSKAPIKEIIRVSGIYEARTIEFSNGTDYSLSSDGERIVWDESERTPAPGSTFFVTYESDSILKRYLDASDDELEITQDAVIQSINGKFVDTATGDDLDRIGDLFGDVIGARRGRVDSDYRAYLKSVVQSFVSRGTISGIKTAIAAATGADIENISINENFNENSYEVVVIPETPIAGSTIEEIAEIADPSGVEQSLTRFTPDDDTVGVDDEVFIKDGIETDDTTTVSDEAVADANTSLFDEDVSVTDDVGANVNTTALADTAISDDSASANGNLTQETESVTSDDALERVSERDKNSFVWGEDAGIYGSGWDFSEWTE